MKTSKQGKIHRLRRRKAPEYLMLEPSLVLKEFRRWRKRLRDFLHPKKINKLKFK